MGLVRTVVTYQSFGYGPVMKALKFLMEAQQHLGDDVILLAAASDEHIIAPNHFLMSKTRIYYCASSDEKITRLSQLGSIDQIIAFNDYEPIVWGFFNGVHKRIAVDGLFHLWLIDRAELPQQKQLFAKYTQTSFAYMRDLGRSLLGRDPHKAIIWKHYFATHSFLGNYVGAAAKSQDFLDNGLMRLAGQFDFMPYPNRMIRAISPGHNLLLVNLGGGNYPTMTLSQERMYCKLAANVVKDYVASLRGHMDFATKIVVVHPALFGYVSTLFRDFDYIVLESLSISEYTKILNLASLVISAPGNTAVFEAVYQKKPVFLLPEKHIEQLNFTNLLRDDFVCASLAEYVPDMDVALSSEHGSVAMLMRAAKKVLHGKNMSLVNKTIVSRFLQDKDGYLAVQQARLHSIYGAHNGTKQLSRGIYKVIQESA